jgi:hypothetical protein
MLRREDECNAEADKQLADFVSSQNGQIRELEQQVI